MKHGKKERSAAADINADRKAILERLATTPPAKTKSEAEEVVMKFRGLIRRAIRAGHSLQTLADELKLSKRTLQRQLTNAGLFFRRPRVKNGKAIRRYKNQRKLVK